MGLDKTFSKEQLSISEEKTVYSGFFRIKQFLLKYPLFQGGESGPVQRELFCRGDSVGVLLYDPELDRVGLVKQFRIGCLENKQGPWVWELIAGINDKKAGDSRESAREAAVREVREESGIDITTNDLIPIHQYYNSPGGSDEQLELFCAITSLNVNEGVYGLAAENEDILFQPFDYSQAINAMLSGTVNNAATIIALQWLQLNCSQLKEKFCQN